MPSEEYVGQYPQEDYEIFRDISPDGCFGKNCDGCSMFGRCPKQDAHIRNHTENR